MTSITSKIKKITDDFLDNIREAFGNELISVILYGPAARGEKLKYPYITFMVVVTDNSPSELAPCSKYVKEWQKKLITVPLFLTQDYIKRSLDTYPLEFMEMASSYHVVFGEDMFKGLSFDRADVRSECEREVKGKLLHLRAEYLNLHGNTRGLIDLVQRSLNTFRLLFSGALYLKGQEIPAKTEDILEVVCEAYDLDISLFKRLNAIAKGEVKIDKWEADSLFDLYVEELDKLSNEIDKMS